MLLGYKPVQHVTILNTVGNCNTMGSIVILYYNIIILWDHRRICGPSLTETSFCGAYLYRVNVKVCAVAMHAVLALQYVVFTAQVAVMYVQYMPNLTSLAKRVCGYLAQTDRPIYICTR